MAYGKNAPFGLRPVASIDGGAWSEKTNKYNIYASPDGATTYTSPIFTGDPVVWGTSIGAAPQTTGGVDTIAVYTTTLTVAAPSTFTATPIIGVFQGCEYTRADGVYVKSAYWPGNVAVLAGSEITAFISDDARTIYEIQISTNVNANAGAFVANPIFPNTNNNGGATPYARYGAFGRNFALYIGGGTNFNTVNSAYGGTHANNPASGNAKTGQSAFYLDVSTVTTAGADRDYDKTVVTLPLRALGYSTNSQNVAGPGLTLATTPFINVLVTLNNPVWAAGTAAPVFVD